MIFMSPKEVFGYILKRESVGGVIMLKSESALLDALFEGVFITDETGKILYWNQGAKRITGYSSTDMIGRYYHDDHLNPTDELGRLIYLLDCPIRATLTDGKERKLEVYVQHKRGHRLPIMMKISAQMESDQINQVMISFVERFDVENLSSSEHVKDDLDALTGLPNAKQIETVLKCHLNASSHREIQFGIAIADIDDFEGMNQIYGDALSDEVLKLLSTTFRHTFRSADFIGRWKNDEFIFIFNGITRKMLNQQCEKIRIMSENSSLRGYDPQEINMSVSVGATLSRPEDTFETLIERLKDRLKKAKSKGGNSSMTS